MSFFEGESLGNGTVITFEDLQRGLGSLSLASREAMDQKAQEVFEDADALAAQYGPASVEAARADELVMLYSMLELHPSIYRRAQAIPAQRPAAL